MQIVRGWCPICSIPISCQSRREIFEHFLILSCLKSKLGVFNGWFNGDFAKCMARNENNLWIATAVTLKNTFFGFVIGRVVAASRRA